MSGSGGSGGYIPPSRSSFDCSSSEIEVNVSSIDLTVLRSLKVGDLLEIEVSQNGALILIDANGQTLGAVMHLNTKDIIACINNGHKYNAIITSINFPACRIKIKSV